MKTKHSREDRQVKRCYQCNRLHEQLLDQAYERIWPQVRRRLVQQRDDSTQSSKRLPNIRAGA